VSCWIKLQVRVVLADEPYIYSIGDKVNAHIFTVGQARYARFGNSFLPEFRSRFVIAGDTSYWREMTALELLAEQAY